MWFRILIAVFGWVPTIIESVAKARRAKREQEARLGKEKAKAKKTPKAK